MATAVDTSMGAAVAANDNDAVGTAVPPSSTNDKDPYIGASVAFKGVCVGAFADGAGESAAASALLPPRCRRCAVCRRRTANVAVSPQSCRHRCCRCRCSAVCWLIVALLSAVRFCHRMPSCDPQHSHCRRDHFCTNWYVLTRTTSILAINIATRTNCMNLYKKIKSNSKNNPV